MNQWQCQDCYKTISLDSHGRCPLCGSDAVLPVDLLELTHFHHRQHQHSDSQIKSRQ